jgi:hypothetical protein
MTAITLKKALLLIDAAKSKAIELGFAASVVVLDLGGNAPSACPAASSRRTTKSRVSGQPFSNA